MVLLAVSRGGGGGGGGGGGAFIINATVRLEKLANVVQKQHHRSLVYYFLDEVFLLFTNDSVIRPIGLFSGRDTR